MIEDIAPAILQYPDLEAIRNPILFHDQTGFSARDKDICLHSHGASPFPHVSTTDEAAFMGIDLSVASLPSGPAFPGR